LAKKQHIFTNPICQVATSPSAISTTTDPLWRIHHTFRLHILWASYVNVKDVDLIYVRVGVYHGTEPLCQEKHSRQVATNLICEKHLIRFVQVGPADPKWDEWLNMEINVLDIPRSAKLCLSICSVDKYDLHPDTNPICSGEEAQGTGGAHDAVLGQHQPLRLPAPPAVRRHGPQPLVCTEGE
jgi:hypothetical protein